MGRKRDNLNAWEMSLIESALRLWAKQFGVSETSRDQCNEMADKFLNAKSVTVTHG